MGGGGTPRQLPQDQSGDPKQTKDINRVYILTSYCIGQNKLHLMAVNTS